MIQLKRAARHLHLSFTKSNMGDAAEEYEEVDQIDELEAAEAETANEAQRLKQQKESGVSRDGSETGSKGDGFDKEAQKEVDARSIYVGNVDYSVDSKSIAEFFSSCGTVNRVTIPGNKDKHPKGYAYVEFLELEAVENALKLDGSEIAGRNIKVNQKRTNEAGVSRGRGRGRTMRGRGGRGRGAWPMMPMMPMPYAPFDPFMGGGGYSPYARFSPTRGRGRGRGRIPGRGRGATEQEADA